MRCIRLYILLVYNKEADCIMVNLEHIGVLIYVMFCYVM